ncbi:MAG: hypothetical protein KH284_14700 [Clostridiales bacterium]|nr:hypothetical protein [Clostridiales bacterium]
MQKLKKIMSILLIVCVLSTSAYVLIAQAKYVYGHNGDFEDPFSTSTYYDSPKRIYSERDATAKCDKLGSGNGSTQEFWLFLHVRTWGTYNQFGAAVKFNTTQNGYYYVWENANPNRYSNNYAYFNISKAASNSTTIFGRLFTNSQTAVAD